MHFARIMLGFCLLSFSAPDVFSAMLPNRTEIDGWLKNLGSNDQFDAGKGIDWGILPGPFYTPELGLGLGMAVVGMYRPDSNDATSQTSTLSLSGFVSSTGALGLDMKNYSFFADDQWRFYFDGTLNDMPTYYWGTGFNAGRDDGDKQKYTAKELSLQPQALYRIAPATYLGAGWSFSAEQADDIAQQDKNAFALGMGGPSVLSSGASASFIYDTRDFVANPSRGQLINLTNTYFSPALGGDSRFDTLAMQYDLYQRVNEKTIIAWDLYSRFANGDVPWNMLSELGNSYRMRGYYEGRYRDRDVLSTQLEYRRQLDWRHGIVAWLATGTMSHQAHELGESSWLPSIGAGYRFEFKPRMNVRLDFGVGKASTGFYFQVGEAF